MKQTLLTILLLVGVAAGSAAVGVVVAGNSFDAYVDTLTQEQSVDVTRVKPTVVTTAVDAFIDTVQATASPASYALIDSADRIHADGVVPDRAVAYATALTSDGWFLVPQSVMQRYGSRLRVVSGTEVVPVESWVIDPATDQVFAYAPVEQVRVSTFGSSDRIESGLPVYVVVGEMVYPRVLVDAWHRDAGAVESSDSYDRRFLLDMPVDVPPGALVADGNGSVIGLLEDTGRVRPLHQVIAGLEQLLDAQRVVRPALGVAGIDQRRVVQEDGSQDGWRITSVVRGSAADQAGLQVGDVILRVQGVSVHTQPLAEQILGAQVEDVLLLTVLREGTEQEISVTL